MKIALYQMHIIWEEKEANYLQFESKLKEMYGKKVELVLLPEMSFTGFSMKTDVTKESNLETVNKMADYAKKYQLAIGFGWVKDGGERSENHYSVVNKYGEILADYTKIHSFLYGGEGEQFNAGESLSQFELGGLNFTLFICYDLRFPEVFRLTSSTTDAYIVPANWPEGRIEHWDTLVRARAIENQSYVLGINCVGDIGGLQYKGSSVIVEPDGKIMAHTSNEEAVIYGILEKKKLLIRKEFNVMKDRREELYYKLYESANMKM